MSDTIKNIDSNSLAIVIPAYKEEYFEKALNSLAAQTNKNFTVYIGDDNSPFNLLSIVDNYKGVLNIQYTRFKDNIGSKNLVLQWERCVKLSNNEKWIWLFSDDDIAEKKCVENFFNILKKNNNRFDVYRFNVNVIDTEDQLINYTPFGPEEESSEQMAYHLLKGERGNSMPDHIFTREIYDQYGFVFTDYAQGADWATSILFSRNKGMCIIPESKVYWRYSGKNISSTASQNRNKTMDGHLQFINWLLKHFEYLKNGSSTVSYSQMLEAMRFNVYAVIINHYKGFGFMYGFKLTYILHNKLKLSYFNVIKELIKIKRETNPLIKKVFVIVRFVKKTFKMIIS